jgi:hypothetical protein
MNFIFFSRPFLNFLTKIGVFCCNAGRKTVNNFLTLALSCLDLPLLPLQQTHSCILNVETWRSKSMMQITRLLADSSSWNSSAASELLPAATLSLGVNGDLKSVNIVLEGAIVGTSTKALNKFFREVACLPGNRWTLQMKHLRLLSLRGIQSLVRFAKNLRRRGFALEVRGVHRNVYASLKDLNLVHEFGWAD